MVQVGVDGGILFDLLSLASRGSLARIELSLGWRAEAAAIRRGASLIDEMLAWINENINQNNQNQLSTFNNSIQLVTDTCH